MSDETKKASFSDFLKKHKVSVSVAGTTLVLATAYGSCTFAPSFSTVEEEEVVEEVVEEEVEAPTEAPEDAEAPAEESAEEEPAEEEPAGE